MEDWDADQTETISGECTSWCTALLWIVPAKVQGTWETPQGTLTLKQQYQKLSGTLGSSPIADGKMNGDEITFKVGERVYTGKVNGSTIEGKGAGGAWTAKKR
jgi:hypothetical protein